MSYKTIGTVTCPHCGSNNKTTFWAVINNEENPRVAQRVRNGELFTHTCKHCGKQSIMSYNTVYEDNAHKAMVFYSKSILDIAEANITLQQRKMTFGDHDSCRIRIVTTPNALKEKIRIFEMGLDDRVIEIMKAAVLENKCVGMRDFGRIDEVVCWPVDEHCFAMTILGEKAKDFLVKKELYDVIYNKVHKILDREECPNEVGLDFAIEFIDKNHFIIR